MLLFGAAFALKIMRLCVSRPSKSMTPRRVTAAYFLSIPALYRFPSLTCRTNTNIQRLCFHHRCRASQGLSSSGFSTASATKKPFGKGVLVLKIVSFEHQCHHSPSANMQPTSFIGAPAAQAAACGKTHWHLYIGTCTLALVHWHLRYTRNFIRCTAVHSALAC